MPDGQRWHVLALRYQPVGQYCKLDCVDPAKTPQNSSEANKALSMTRNRKVTEGGYGGS